MSSFWDTTDEATTPEKSAGFWDTPTEPSISNMPMPSFGMANTTKQTVQPGEVPDLLYPFKIREVPVETRRMFEATPIETTLPPIITGAASFGFMLAEALPLAVSTLYGEVTRGKSLIDQRRLGAETPEYVTASKKVTDAVDKGENVWLAGLRVMSEKTLDIAFGAQIFVGIAKTVTAKLLQGGIEAKVLAQDTVNAYKANQKTIFERLQKAPLDVREKALADLANAKNAAEKVLKEQGVATTADRAKVAIARYTEVAGRETPIVESILKPTKAEVTSYPSRMAKADVYPKKASDIGTSFWDTPIAGELPGYRPVGGKAPQPSFGLSIQPVEKIGGESPDLFIRKTTALEIKSPTAQSKGFNTIPEKEGYNKVFKPYGANGAGYYYSKMPKVSEVAPTPLGEAPKPTPAVSIDPLKYKTAEEYVKAQGTPVYHGSGSDFKEFDTSKLATIEKDRSSKAGFWFSESKDTAKSYGKNIKEVSLDLKNPKVVDAEGKMYGDFREELETAIAEAKKSGNDGLIIKNFSDRKDWGNYEETTHYLIFDPKNIKTRAQLTSIWEKGQATTKVVEAPKEVISAIDRLIADGKVRVVSRDSRDVYQIQKAGKWVNARDESSAVKQLTEKYVPKPKVYSPADTEKIYQNEVQLQLVRERIAEHPGKILVGTINKKEGDFFDFKNPNLAKNENEKQRIIAKNTRIMRISEGALQETKYSDVYDDPDAIREVIDDYRVARETEKGLVAQKKELAKTLKPISEKVPPKPPLKSSPLDTTTGEGRSIEIQANQALDIVAGEPFPIDVSLPKIIENTVTNVNKKVHFVDTYLRTPHFVMEKIGFGKEAELLRDAMDAYWKELPKNLDVITNWSKQVSKEGNKNIFRFLDGEAITLPPAEKKVALEIKDWLKDWAVKLNLPADNTITHYITHIFDKELLAKEFDEELAKIIADKIPGSVYDPFLLKRLGAKGYIQDTWVALDAYTKRATRKVNLDPVLERIQNKAGQTLEFSNVEKSQWNYIKKYIDNINIRPSETEEAIDNFVKSVIGYKLGQRPVIATLKFLRQATFRGMLGLNPTSALRNLSQGINTYAVLKEKYTVIGYANLFKKGAGEELAREGVLDAGFVQDRALNATKKTLEKADKVLFAFFETAEKINRGAAYFGAKSKALTEGMTETEAIKYAKSIVRKTQFVFDSVDTPVGMSNTLMKTLFQFQTFTTKQMEFLTHMAKDRNFAGLLRYALAGIAFVYTIGKAFGMEPKELLPWYRFDIPPSLKAPVEMVKAVTDAPNKYGRDRTVKEKISDVGKSTIGLIPAGSQIKKTLGGIESVKEGGSFTKSGNLQFKQGESLAEKVQSVLFGKYASQNAKDYYAGETVAEKLYKELKKLPPEEANARLDKLETEDPSLSNQVDKLMRDAELGITDDDKKIRAMGVVNGERARYIYDEAMKLKTSEERNKYLDNLDTKNIITDTVDEQLQELIQKIK